MEYKRPTQRVFKEIKRECIRYWKATYSNEFGYVDEKVEYINLIKNQEADVMFMLNMFDRWNRMFVIAKLSDEAKIYIKNYDDSQR